MPNLQTHYYFQLDFQKDGSTYRRPVVMSYRNKPYNKKKITLYFVERSRYWIYVNMYMYWTIGPLRKITE